MEQRDIIKDQIEQLGKVLSIILSDLIGRKNNGQLSQGIEVSHQQLKSELDIDLETLSSFDKSELRSFIEFRKFTPNHAEVLSEIVSEMAKAGIQSDKAKAMMLLQKASDLLTIADELSNTMSFDRIYKNKELENLLKQHI